MNKRLGINAINTELTKWAELRAQLETADLNITDLVDTLEGETELFEALLMVSDEIAERTTMSAAIKQRIDDLSVRKSRIDKAAETLRSIITQSMDRAGIKTIPGDLCTMTLSDTPSGSTVTDEAQLPAKYFKIVDPVINKKLIGEDMKTGIVIPGVSKTNGGIKLTIRRK